MNTIDQFEAFVDFISNIDKQKATIAQLKDATKQYQDAVTTLSKAQDLAKWETALKTKQDKGISDLKDQQQVLDNQAKQLQVRVSELDAREVLLNKQANDQQVVMQGHVETSTHLAEVAQDLVKKEANLNEQIAKYNSLAADLTAKQEALSKVFK